MTPPLPTGETVVMFLCLMAGIMATRFIPFLVFHGSEKPPGWVLYLGGALPHAAMAMLLVYCLKDVAFLDSPHGLPEAVAILFTGGLHWWRRNALLSMGLGTALYMALVQCVFG